ncbi:GH39 family glycosyl hydrolase [Anaerocolumna sp. MB42-C2]|uniref:GH39 family glycosyl hydrolase n=1 Tax=Anaerocolumna sp. MB42-C2 TaxID=3070997 RepID=UPI0027DF96C6|nr:helix-turn-helix domain-containing protein [Anaerocolumna sp. MB42-C2]WMJ87321.1 helix-turn-helix domain-containing protein [Anaerocolumna sp. MB42-C2]
MYKHEIIEYSKDVPIRVSIQRMENTTRHWHGSIEIYLVLSGDITVILESETFHLIEDDILLINSNQLHEIHCNDNVVAVLQIKHSYFKQWINDSTFFEVNSSIFHNKSRFLELKRSIAKLIYLNYNNTDCDDLLCISHSYQLLHELVKNFKCNDTKLTGNKSKNLKRLKGIIEYLNDNYTENITLNTVAEREYLSASYLSHFFEKNMGVSFFNFLTGIRMNHAVNDLLNTNLTIEQIAANNGFANSRYFVSCFKKEYGILPKQYQKEHRKETDINVVKAQKISDYLLIEQHDFLNKLGEYLESGNTFKKEKTDSSFYNIINVNVSNLKCSLLHTFKTFTGVGRAKDMLMQKVQYELITLQKEIGFQYIKFHGILDDSMMLYNEDKSGNPYLTFTYVDEVLDFLLSIGFKPLIQLSFMPKLLAKNPESTIFYNPVILSEPNNYNKWVYYITELTKHFIKRYGLSEVRTWLFSFWNVPFKTYVFAFETNEIAYELYRITRNCVKECDPHLLFGTPSYGSINFASSEFYDFLDYCKANNCYPDFYNIHCYPVKTSTTKDLATLGESYRDSENDKIILSDDPDYMAHTIDCYKKKMTGYPKLPTYITEWASTSSHRDWLNDTCYRSSYIIKNILENYDSMDSFCNWCISDTLEELPLSNEEFHGELGLFTLSGIKKPAYYAFTFLNKLLDTLIDKGNGYFITTNQKGDYAIILYNYSHISPLYAQGVLFNVTFLERYNAIVDANSMEADLVLTQIENGDYILTEQIVNRDYGSAFDEWVRMGALPLTSEEEINTLKGRSMPKINKMNIQISNNLLNYYADLKPHEIRLVTIKKQLW